MGVARGPKGPLLKRLRALAQGGPCQPVISCLDPASFGKQGRIDRHTRQERCHFRNGLVIAAHTFRVAAPVNALSPRIQKAQITKFV